MSNFFIPILVIAGLLASCNDADSLHPPQSMETKFGDQSAINSSNTPSPAPINSIPPSAADPAINENIDEGQTETDPVKAAPAENPEGTSVKDEAPGISLSAASHLDLARKYAPRIYMHPGELYFPSSAEFFLANVNIERDFLVTKQSLGCDSCSDPGFLSGQRPDKMAVPIYAQFVNRTKKGVATDITDIIYWTFYPYNQGKRVCVGAYLKPLGCIGGYSTFGNHVGDWEHITIRFVGNIPTKIALSAHGKSSISDFSNKSLKFVGGTHVAVYSAIGSHGLYFNEGQNKYLNLPNGDYLADVMAQGVAWDSWNNVIAFDYQNAGTYKNTLSWLNLSQRWGNPKSGCGIIESISGECVLNPGPLGPLFKNFALPEFDGFE